MPIQLDHHGDVAIARILETRLDASCCESMRQELGGLLESHAGHIVIDLMGVQSIDSSGIGTIAGISKRAGDAREVVIVGAGEAVRTIFAMTRLDKVIALYDDTDAALEALAKSD